jgi:hypothetical protein
MTKKPKLKKIRVNESDFTINRTVGNETKPRIINKEFISYKLSPGDKMSLAIGYFALFGAMTGCIYYCLSQSQKIDSTSNTQWASSFVLSLFLDFAVVEIVAITVSTLVLKKVGQHPANFGKARNYVIKYGPRAIRTAVISFGSGPKKKKKKKQEEGKSSERRMKREKAPKKVNM